MALHALAPESPPACSLEAVPIGCIGKAAFHQMPPSPPIPFCRPAGRLHPQPIQFDLSIQPLHPPPMLGVSALAAQRTSGALRCRRLVLPAAFVGSMLPAF